MTDDDTLAPLPADDWLKGDSLKLIYLFQLARGLHPLDRLNWSPESPWDARWRHLKSAIDTGKLPAMYANQATKNTIVSLADLLNFANGAAGQWEAWQWARDLCQRWGDVCGEVLLQSTEKPIHTSNKSSRGARPRIDYIALLDALKSVAKLIGGDDWIKRQSTETLAKKAVAKMEEDGIEKKKTPAADTARKYFDKMRKNGRLS